MNCESCKNKHATVFYADEGGGRHALCQACAQSLGKISHYSPASEGAAKPFIPETYLASLSPQKPRRIYVGSLEESSRAVCPYCATSLDLLCQRAVAGCPECYVTFSELLFPSSLSPERAVGARMPSSYKSQIDRTRTIAELKAQIKIAIEAENYELAATLRDKIRKLEAPRKM